MIEVRDIGFRYGSGDFVLNVPAVGIEQGESLAMIGASGTGKTTLLNLMAGFLVPDSGSIRVKGETVSTLDDAGRRDFRIRNVGLVFQEFELLGYLSVIDNILLPYRISAALKLDADVRGRAEALAVDVGLGTKLGRNVDRLSQGERQRVAVCRALLPEPSVLLCDEPTGNLDPTNKDLVLDILFRHVGRAGTTLVVVTHDYDILARFDRTIDFRQFGANTKEGAGAG